MHHFTRLPGFSARWIIIIDLRRQQIQAIGLHKQLNYPHKHEHEQHRPYPLLASKVSSGCFNNPIAILYRQSAPSSCLHASYCPTSEYSSRGRYSTVGGSSAQRQSWLLQGFGAILQGQRCLESYVSYHIIAPYTICACCCS